MARNMTAPWWEPGSSEPPHKRLMPLIRSLLSRQATRYQNMRKMISVYEGGSSSQLGASSGDEALNEYRLHFNAAKNAIDTLHAQVCTPRVQPMLLTQGGNFFQRQRAKECTKAVEGIFEECDFEEVQEDVTLDAMLAYCGFLKVCSEVEEVDPEDGEREDYFGRVLLQRVSPLDVLIDDAEGRHRKPRCMYQREMIDRSVLLAEYGEAEDDLFGSAKTRRQAIEKARSGATTPEEFADDTDMVEVWEAWHLPSGPVRRGKDGKPRTDGLHVIAIENATLFVEPWTRCHFPLAVYRPEKARKGFWGLAAMQWAMAGQREFERVTEKIQRAHRLIGGMHFIANEDVNVKDITNGVGKVIKVKGDVNAAVREWTPQAVSPDTYAYRNALAGDMLRYLGISEYAAQSQVPAGLQQASGKALQAFEDQENKRIILRHRERERFVVECTRLVIEEANALVDRGVKVVARHRDKSGFVPIDWKDLVEILGDESAYVVKTFPVSRLSQNPAAKFAQLDALLERGAITVEQFKRLFDLPDIEAETDIDCADYEIVDRNIDYMITHGEYTPPQAFDDLELIKVRGTKAINAYRIREVPDERLELLRRYVADADAMVQEAAAKAAAAAQSSVPSPGTAPGEPMALEGTTPVMPGAPPGAPMM